MHVHKLRMGTATMLAQHTRTIERFTVPLPDTDDTARVTHDEVEVIGVDVTGFVRECDFQVVGVVEPDPAEEFLAYPGQEP